MNSWSKFELMIQQINKQLSHGWVKWCKLAIKEFDKRVWDIWPTKFHPTWTPDAWTLAQTLIIIQI